MATERGGKTPSCYFGGKAISVLGICMIEYFGGEIDHVLLDGTQHQKVRNSIWLLFLVMDRGLT